MSNFNPLLANNFNPAKARWPLVATGKYDGVRAMTQLIGPVTRSRKLIPNLHIREALSALPLNLDGELIAGTFQETQSAVMTHTGRPDFQFYVFDYFSSLPYINRMDLLARVDLPSFCRFVPTQNVSCMSDLEQFEERVLSEGLEGVVLRDPTGRYKQGRSTPRENYLARFTREERDEAEVIGFEERMHNANEQTRDERGYAKRSTHQENMVPMDTLGALQLRMQGAHFKCGTGFTDTQRQYIWDNRDQFVGSQCTIKFKGWGSKGRPRQPVFMGWRNGE
jgi:DNA ligase-1